MLELENQAFSLSKRNWCRKNCGWETSFEAKRAKINRDALINKAWLNAAANYLTARAQEINKNLSVRTNVEEFWVALEYNSASLGMTVKLGSPFAIEELLDKHPDINSLLGI